MYKNYIKIMVKTISWHMIAATLILSCAGLKGYFNTYYNAEQYFIQAEKIRIDNRDQLPSSALDLYEKVIVKSNMVISSYPDFTFRKNAFLLIIQSHFYKENYFLSEEFLSTMGKEFGLDDDYQFWLAMINWKKGNTQLSINLFTSLSSNRSSIKELRSRSLMIISEIYNELGNDELSMQNLEKAAILTSNKDEKARIFFDIASKHFSNFNYDRSLSSFMEVLKNSNIKKDIHQSNLKIIQLHRVMGNNEKAANLIKNLLIDESYKSIYGNLEVELAKILHSQGKYTESKNRYVSITEKYPNTSSSAESMFYIGNHYIENDRDLKKAKEYYKKVSEENNSSMYIQSSISKIKEIDVFVALQKQYQSWIDSMSLDSIDIAYINKDRSDLLYELGELEAFHFSHLQSGIEYLELLIDKYPNSQRLAQTLFTKSYILERQNKLKKSKKIKIDIMKRFSESIYAKAIILSDSNFTYIKSLADQQLIIAEKMRSQNSISALQIYKEIILSDTVSIGGASAGFYVGNYYDYNEIDPDSALKYYSWVERFHPFSEQAKISKERIKNIILVLSDTTRINMSNINE